MTNKAFEELPILGEPITELDESQKRRQTRPAGSAISLEIAQNASLLKEKKELLTVICSDPSDVIRFKEEVKYFDPSLNIVSFPDWETLPYDVLSPHADLIGERLETLYLLLKRENAANPIDVLVVSSITAAQRLAPKNFFNSTTFFFKKGQKTDPIKFRSELVNSGYEHVSQVIAPGEFATRGGIVDLYPMGATAPYRIDFFDDEVDEIRIFDPDTQRSLERVKEIRLLPGHEFPMDETARKNFCSRWREVFEGNPSRYNTYKDVESGIASPGLENYLPLFFDETSTLFDYIGTNSRFMLIGDVHESLIKFFKETEERARFLRADNQTAILDLKLLYQTPEEFAKACDKYSRLIVQPPKEPEPAVPGTVSIDRKNSDPLINIRKFCEEASKKKIRTLILAPSQGRLETISQLFREYKFLNHPVKSFEDFLSIPDKVCLGSGSLFDGLYLNKQKIAILTESELYSLPTGTLRRRRIRGRERESSVDMIIRDLSELKIGSPVVHLEHGIGRYKGLVTIEGDEGPAEFLHIEYGGGTSLYVPVTQLHLISRYAGADPDNAPLHTLGKGDWEKARKKAAKMVHDTAAELLNIYALRQARKGHAFKFSQNDYEAFSEDFPFEETEDQIAAINSVEKDMSSTKPMDRLVCGDVGFGKTEVALRAAFMAVMDHKQVAVLCPTTLLAEQHAQTFRDRFAKWPVKIAELSRFRSQKEVKAALEGIKDGTVDIVVGTHKLLSEDVKFKNLGLVVIDEEHRFGVRQKEKLKALRAEVDVLTLTATPIPRTLSMSLEGIRDFSVIATAPQMRLAIKTFVQRESDSVIREAVIRELKRGGQVYYLHNEVETIQAQLEHLKKLVPEARIGVAHGQMDERELEKVMRDFNAQRTNLLLCTTIIENGIDIPNANTIIMHRADKLGLAQLHQLRGRVGRSHHQAYAYLLTPGEDAITKNAEKRLEAIQEMEDLGSGFFLAMHDLEIRGAGEVLGDQQSGSITGVGFELYTQMLESAVKSLKAGKEPDLLRPVASVAEVNLHSPALLLPDYVADVHARLRFYKRLAASKTEDQINDIQEEIVDRYGPLNDAARTLILSHKIRLEATEIGIKRIDAAKEVGFITFTEDAPVDTSKLFKLLQSRRDIKMTAPTRMRLENVGETAENRAEAILGLIKELK